MKLTKLASIFFLSAILLLTCLSCTPVDGVQITLQNLEESTSHPSETPTDQVEPEPMTPTPEESEREQIVYVSNGNIWRYFVDSGEMSQITQDGYDDYEGRYNYPHLSPGGHFVAYTKAGSAYIHSFDDGRVIELSSYDQFINWSDTEGEFFVLRGDHDCDSLGDIDDQAQLNYDVLRYKVDSLDNPELIANIGGGMQVPQAITPDGAYAAFRKCYCYSECGGASLWHLPSATILSGPDGTEYGSFSFSPDLTQLAVTSYEPHLYLTGELYIANIDFSDARVIYTEPGVVPTNPIWSPDGEWIAFTAVYFGGEDQSEIYSQAMLIRPDGGEPVVVDENYSAVINWAPDSSRLLHFWRGLASNMVYSYILATGNRPLLPIEVGDHLSMDWGRLP